MMQWEQYFKYIKQPVLVIDNLSQVMLINPAFSSLFPPVRCGETIYAYIDACPVLGTILATGSGRTRIHYQDRIYSVHVSTGLFGKKDLPAMKCFLLSDTTETADMLRKTDQVHAKLKTNTIQLQKQNIEIERNHRLEEAVAVARETSIMLREMHDTLGHTLTILNALNKLALRALPSVEESRTELREALRITRISLADLEAAETDPEGGLTAFLSRLQKSIRRAGLDIAIHFTGEELPCHRYMLLPLMRICQEAATNSIRHGDATKMEVVLEMGLENVRLSLIDNGQTKPDFQKGNGLIGMEERVNDLFGDIHMGPAEGGGFAVEVNVPVILDDGE